MVDPKFLNYNLRSRKTLIKWSKIVCELLEFSEITKHLGIFLSDLFLEYRTEYFHCHSLTLIVCLALAAIHQEKLRKVPNFAIVRFILNYDLQPEDYIRTKNAVIVFFNWKFNYPTSAQFAEIYILMSLMDVQESRTQKSTLSIGETSLMTKHKNRHCVHNISNAKYLLFLLSSHTYHYLDTFLAESSAHRVKYAPSMIASVCVYAARAALHLSQVWPQSLLSASGYTEKQLHECFSMLCTLLYGEAKDS